MELLGIRKTSYYQLLRTGLLKSSRLWSGGPRRHTQQELDDYLAYLNSDGQTAVERTAESEFETRRRKRLNRRTR
jgi:hypothetical protein